MQILEKTSTKPNIDPLICTLYTILEDNSIFKNVNIKHNIFLNKKNPEKPIPNSKIFQELYILVNRLSLRKFAYLLIKPLLISTNSSLFSNIAKTDIQKNESETTLLKKYLQRFQYNYRRYFLYQNGNYENPPTNKEINTYAIKTLFLLAGI
jgi:hypothetical protein